MRDAERHGKDLTQSSQRAEHRGHRDSSARDGRKKADLQAERRARRWRSGRLGGIPRCLITYSMAWKDYGRDRNYSRKLHASKVACGQGEDQNDFSYGSERECGQGSCS